MKSIPLSQGYFALVDDEDFERLNEHKWCVARVKANKWYAVRNETVSFKKRRRISMHRYLLGILDSPKQVDHIDGNGLNNQRSNMRECTVFENQYNVGVCSRNKSGYKGVSWNINRKSWVSHINYNGIRKFLGYFSDAKKSLRRLCFGIIGASQKFLFF
jgi:hypothetical protein